MKVKVTDKEPFTRAPTMQDVPCLVRSGDGVLKLLHFSASSTASNFRTFYVLYLEGNNLGRSFRAKDLSEYTIDFKSKVTLGA